DFKQNPALMSWFKYVGAGRKVFLKSGLTGDQYSLPVLQLIIKEVLKCQSLLAENRDRHDTSPVTSSSSQTDTLRGGSWIDR
ncbi:hypothetical protein BHZ79_29640, partial [Salmonella enterica]|nr:hypothetical protein [Salmonella enterica]